MKEIEIKDLYDADYSVTVINALRQYWKKTKCFDCIGAPKRYHMLLILDGCRAVYTRSGGERIFVSEGSIVYTPVGSEYAVEFYDFRDAESKTVHINFLLHDAENEPFSLGGDIRVLTPDNADYKAIFREIDRYSEATVQCHARIKSIMYDLLFKLSSFYHKGQADTYAIIAEGIAYLEQNEEQALSIAEIAKKCHVSEVYFRRLFKEYSGSAPSDFRLYAKICRAKNYLLNEALSIAEISDILGFCDVSYFIKQFKKYTAVTPKKYREAHAGGLGAPAALPEL